MHVIALGYVGVEARDSRRWIAFAEEVLGLRATETEDGLVLLRMDERAYRIAVHPGNRDGLAYLGWELPNVPALERAADELTQQGVTFERGTEEECARRQVRGLLRFVDPAGSPLELFCGQRFNSTPFLPTRPVSGFLTGPLGMGHVVIRTPEAQATADFYTNVLGFRISDYFADRLIFLHCNGRHHSVAFGNLGPGRGLSHIMLEAKSFDDVGLTYDLVRERQIPIGMELGRHSNDLMYSFYMQSPSGFQIEYGYGGRIVDDATWTVTQLDRPSIWGHQRRELPVQAPA